MRAEQASENIDGTTCGRSDGEHPEGQLGLDRDGGGVPLLRQRQRRLARFDGAALATNAAPHGSPSRHSVPGRHDGTGLQWPGDEGIGPTELRTSAWQGSSNQSSATSNSCTPWPNR